MSASGRAGLGEQCELLRSLHRPGDPLLLPNAWDVPTARAVVAAGFPVVATTSRGVAATLGHEDHEQAPGAEMLEAAGRIARNVEVPVTVDAEAGYGMEPAELVAALQGIGAAGCNLEETDHSTGSLQDPAAVASFVAAVRAAADAADYPLVINARVDVWLMGFLTGAGPETQIEHVGAGLERANAYLDAGADCAYPITLSESRALGEFMAGVDGPVNVTRMPGPGLSEVVAQGVARISWGILLYEGAMAGFRERLSTLRS